MLGSKELIIEIGTQEVRGVLFLSFMGRTNIERTESFPVTEGETSSALERLLSAFPSDAVITLQLPGSLFMTRRVTLPFSDRKKIKKILPYELDGLLPFPIDELLIDSVLSIPPDKGSSVIAVAIPKKVVSGFLNLFPEGRRPSRVIPDFISLISLGRNIKDEETIYGIADIREDRASLAIISQGKPAVVRSITGSDPVSVAEEISATIKSFADAGQEVEMLYVSGMRTIHELPLLKEMTQVIQLPKVIKSVSDDDWPSWAAISGGALATVEFSSFNILGSGPESERFEKALRTASIGVTLLLILGTADLYLHYRTSARSVAALTAESRRVFLSVMPQAKPVEKKEHVQLKDALKKERETKEALIGKASPSYLVAFKGMEKVIGEHREIRIRETVFEGNNLTISGDGINIDADSVKKLFSGVEGAKRAQVEELVQGIEPNSYRFRIKIEL